jgi:hypothetical protein
MRENHFYRTRPGLAGLFVVLWQVICFACIILFILLFDETPGISVMAIFGFFASLIAMSRGSISVSEDRFIIEKTRVLLEFSDREEYAFSGIAKIEAHLSAVRSTIFITYKHGSVDKVTLFMDRAIAREALDTIRQHSHIRVETDGAEVFRKILRSRVSGAGGAAHASGGPAHAS